MQTTVGGSVSCWPLIAKKAWLHPGWEDTLLRWYRVAARSEEKRRSKEDGSGAPKISQSYDHKRADGSTGLLHKITKPTVWRGGGQFLKRETEDAKPLARREEMRQEWAKHRQGSAK